MCVHESLWAEGEWKGLHDRTQKILELDEYDSVNNNVDGNEGNQNTIENDFETGLRRVGVGVGALVGALVFPQSQYQLRGSWIDDELGGRVGASHAHENQDVTARKTESSTRSTLALGGSLDMAQMGRCVLQMGSFLPEG